MATVVQAPPPTYKTSFSRFAFGVLGWNVLVVLWGAYVRASGSGAGCGSHWPLCNGEVLPASPGVQTIIEFTHRAMSGVALAAVAVLWLWTRRRFLRTAPVRPMAAASAIFLITEALLGAGLVLFKYVGTDESAGRAIYLSLHLLNTLLLLGALALTAWFSKGGFYFGGWRWSRPVMAALPIAALVSVTGAIAALGDTLAPAKTLAQGFQQDFSGAANFLVRLRVLHPAFAILAGCYFVAVGILVLRSKQFAMANKLAGWVIALACVQLCAGAVNLLLLAPVWMQITHLFLADAVWISLVLLFVETKVH
ncbi:MAG TPA: COX15/CtaA family protein [Bryobacteraceae bacterium]|nr:COX15/CtaA family protein [Bryobacteraceae bacterium]